MPCNYLWCMCCSSVGDIALLIIILEYADAWRRWRLRRSSRARAVLEASRERHLQ